MRPEHDRRRPGAPSGERLHVVQVSRDVALLRGADGSEAVERQLDYARELERRTPGSVVTIIVLSGGRPPARGWTRGNLRVVAAGGPLRGIVRTLSLLTRLHRRFPISVITTQVPYDEGWVALAVGRWHRIPVIAQVHSDLFAQHPSATRSRRLLIGAREWLARKTLRAYAAVRTVSSETRASIRRFAAHVPLFTIPVPVPMVSGRPAAAASGKEPLVVFVGRLAAEKDLTTWLRVAAAVHARRAEARFEIVGDGIERRRLEQEAERLGLAGVVRFAGFVSYRELNAVYARASVLLLTSRSEGFGRVLVEAASQGTASVATALAGPRDIVVDGVTGFLHEPGDVDGLARSVAALVEHPERAAAMGERARLLVTMKFHPERLRAAWVDLWVQTAAGLRGAA
jgi:glycosyltransferase involved in cell wall biosynthesis